MGLLSLLDGKLAAVVTALTTYRVVDVPCTAVSALSERRHSCLIVGTALSCTGLGLSSFRMCHKSYRFELLISLECFECCPALINSLFIEGRGWTFGFVTHLVGSDAGIGRHHFLIAFALEVHPL